MVLRFQHSQTQRHLLPHKPTTKLETNDRQIDDVNIRDVPTNDVQIKVV